MERIFSIELQHDIRVLGFAVYRILKLRKASARALILPHSTCHAGMITVGPCDDSSLDEPFLPGGFVNQGSTATTIT